MIEVTYSNRIEELFLQYKNNLLLNEIDPFSIRIVIVPSLAVKAWITEQLCHSSIKSSLGFKVVLLEEALFILKNLCSDSTTLKKVPSKMELSMAIEQNLYHIEELSHFIHQNENSELRCHHLAQTLCSLFQKYGRLSHDYLSGWQKKLWDLVYQETHWTSPEALFKESLVSPSRNLHVDLFALSFLTPIEFDFLKRVSEINFSERAIHFWILSPVFIFGLI